jgi:hypothetical protein
MITRNTTNNVNQSFSFLSTNSLDDDDEPSLLDESENVSIPDWYN